MSYRVAWGEEFYHGMFGKVYLEIDSSKAVVKLDMKLSPDEKDEILTSVKGIVKAGGGEMTMDGFTVIGLDQINGYGAFLDSLVRVEGIIRAEPYYIWKGTEPFIPGETFTVGFNHDVSKLQLIVSTL